MQFEMLLEQVHRLPLTTYWLVFFLSLIGALIINYMFDATLYLTGTAIVFLIVFGLASNALLMINGIMLSHDTAMNIILSTSAGFIVGTLAFVSLVRFWYAAQSENSRS